VSRASVTWRDLSSRVVEIEGEPWLGTLQETSAVVHAFDTDAPLEGTTLRVCTDGWDTTNDSRIVVTGPLGLELKRKAELRMVVRLERIDWQKVTP
jgi:hypothetical protein